MPLYLKKRVRIAPGVNLNLSKSGLGLSVGVKGARVSMGPRGTQINAGRGGIYYRKQLSGKKGRTSASQAKQVRVQQQPTAPAPLGQANGVALAKTQPCTGRWPNKSRPPVFRVGGWQFWTVVSVCLLLMMLAGAS